MSKGKSAKTKKLSRIKELEAENRRLKNEIDILKHELSTVKGKNLFYDRQDKILQSFQSFLPRTWKN